MSTPMKVTPYVHATRLRLAKGEDTADEITGATAHQCGVCGLYMPAEFAKWILGIDVRGDVVQICSDDCDRAIEEERERTGVLEIRPMLLDIEP